MSRSPKNALIAAVAVGATALGCRSTPAPGPAAIAPADGEVAASAAKVMLEPSYRLEQVEGADVSHAPAVVYAEGGRRLITGTSTGEVVTFDATSREVLARRRFAEDAVSAMALSARGDRLVALTGEGRLLVIDMDTGEAVASAEGVAAASALVVSADGRLIALAREKEIELRTLADLAVVRTLRGHEAKLGALAWSADGRLASADEAGRLNIWSAGDEPEVERAVEEGEPLHAVGFSPDGTRIAYGGRGKRVSELVVAGGDPRVITEAQPYWITTVGYAPDGRSIAVGDESCDIWLFDVASGERLFHGKHHVECWLSQVAWTPDSKTFVFGCRPNAHDGKPTVFAQNTIAEVAADPEVARTFEEERAARAALLEACEDEALREQVASALPEPAAPSATQLAYLADYELSSGGTGGPVQDFPGPTIQVFANDVGGGGSGAGSLTFEDEEGVEPQGVDSALLDAGTDIRGLGRAAAVSDELGEALREKVADHPELAERLEKLEAVRSRRAALVQTKRAALAEKFIINQWKVAE